MPGEAASSSWDVRVEERSFGAPELVQACSAAPTVDSRGESAQMPVVEWVAVQVELTAAQRAERSAGRAGTIVAGAPEAAESTVLRRSPPRQRRVRPSLWERLTRTAGASRG